MHRRVSAGERADGGWPLPAGTGDAGEHRRGIADAEERLQALLAIVEPLEPVSFEAFEQKARERLEDHGQPDWPVLAAAMALDAHIWSHDKDFLGVGVPVWSNRNVKHVEAD